jgi:hypothetical protein
MRGSPPAFLGRGLEPVGEVAGRINRVRYTIERQDGHLKAEMVERDTAEETAEFVEAIVAALQSGPRDKLLISIRNSRPVFKVEEWKLSAALDKVMSITGLKVAFIADTREVQMSQQYIALLGRQRGLQFESFDNEPAALAWLTSSS